MLQDACYHTMIGLCVVPLPDAQKDIAGQPGHSMLLKRSTGPGHPTSACIV